MERKMVMPITVLMAVWNPRLEELRKAADSILAQTLRDFEFLIVNDGSTEAGVGRYLAALQSADSRVRVVHGAHRGLTASLNAGVRLAKGELIARQDADDWSEPDRLATQREFFLSNPGATLCGTAAWVHQQNGRRLWRTRPPRSSGEIAGVLERGNPFVHGSAMFSRRAALEVGGYCTALKCSQDYDLFWRLTERGLSINLEAALYHYRYSASSISARKAEEQRLCHRAAQKLAKQRRLGHPTDPDAAIREAGAELELEVGAPRGLLQQADHLLLAGAYRCAARAYFRLAAKHPTNPLTWAKLARCGVFISLPAWREACFR
jgi:glycosyltransferase involved in cell wall biosynthesis